jgi:hypothetical protein
MREVLYNRVKAIQALNSSSITTNTTTDGTSVGVLQSNKNYRQAMFVATCTARTDGTFTLTPQESPTGSGSWTDVPAARLHGSGALTAANTVAEIGVTPDPNVAPFLRLRITSTGVTSGGTVTGCVLLTGARFTPIR